MLPATVRWVSGEFATSHNSARAFVHILSPQSHYPETHITTHTCRPDKQTKPPPETNPSSNHPAKNSADDLISEENETVLQALRRLPPKEAYDRVYRIRRATQLSLQQKILPKAEWTKAEEDVPYLTPVLEQLDAELKERAALDTLAPIRKH